MKKAFLLISFVIAGLKCNSQDFTLKTNTGHTRGVMTIKFTSDGTKLVSSGTDNQVKIWDLITGNEVRSFDSKMDMTRKLDLSPDGKVIAISSLTDKSIKLLNFETGNEIYTIDISKAYADFRGITSIKFFPNGKDLGVLSTGPFFMIDIASGKIKWNYKYAYGGDSGFDISPSGDTILISGMFGITRIDKNGKFLSNYPCGDITSLSISHDGSKILTSNRKKEVDLWNFSTEGLIKKLGSHKSTIESVSISPDGKVALSSSDDHVVKQWDLVTMKEIGQIDWHTDIIFDTKFSPDGLTAASAGKDGKIFLWETQTMKEVQRFDKKTTLWRNIYLANDGKTIITSNTDRLVLWDIATAKPIKQINRKSINWSNVSPDGRLFLTAEYEGPSQYCVKIYDAVTGNETKKQPFEKWVDKSFFLPDNKSVISKGDVNNYDIYLWDTENGKNIWTANLSGTITNMILTPDGKYLAATTFDGRCELVNVETGSILSTLRCEKGGYDGGYTSISCSTDSKYLLLENKVTGNFENYNISEGRFSNLIAKYSFKLLNDDKFRFVDFTKNGSQFLISTSTNRFGIQNISQFQHFSPVESSILKAIFSADNKKIITLNENGGIGFWDIETSKLLATLYQHYNGIDWLAITPEGYFDASSYGGSMVSMVQNDETFGIEQFAVRNNRPDIILKRIGLASQDQTDHLYNQYLKRLRKLGFVDKKGLPSDSLLSLEVHAPKSVVANVKVSGKTATLNALFNDSKYSLKSYNVYVNDVPLFGPYGKPTNGSSDTIAESVSLINGRNIIEVSCLNEKGVESTRAMAVANCTDTIKGNLYFLGFGVSTYKDPKLNLQYAHKDVKDLAACIAQMKDKNFREVFVKTYTNQEVTVTNIKKAKSFLANAKHEDTFILFIAGHGMHDNDKEATYYYLTWEANLNSLKTTTANFETIEDILHGIQPRNKLFLMDACESGELDEDDQNSFLAAATGVGIASRGFKATGQITPSTSSIGSSVGKRSYLYQKDRYIYNDLIRRSGAIVFSSSKGGELSYERSDIQNGLFTEYIMKAFTTNEADKNSDGKITTDELRTYVTAEVAKASNDLQHPTVDRDNRKVKYDLPVVTIK